MSISAVNANNSDVHMDLDSPHPGSNASAPAKPNGNSQNEEEEEEEEDEVMSEGVVHVNKTLTPIALSPQSKAPSANYFSHPLPPLPQSISTHSNHWSQQQQQDQPKTPRTPKQPRTPKTPKTPRQPKKSQNGQRDSSADFFYSPFPLASSPASSPSSPSSFHSQLQMLTHNFVSIQPHASPTNRFRRTPSAITPATATPPFSPPASPGVELMRETPFYPGSSANTSPVKDGSSATNPTTPTSAGFPRSSSGATTPQRSHFKPRWHTQPYMMFLALRAMPDRTAARQELIMAAVELDKKFSAEKGLPRVFTGKVSFLGLNVSHDQSKKRAWALTFFFVFFFFFFFFCADM